MEAGFISASVHQISYPMWQCLQNRYYHAEEIPELDPPSEMGRQMIVEQELEIKAGEKETLKQSFSRF